MMMISLQMVPMLQFLAPNRLWLLLLIPVLVGGYLLLARRRASRRRSMGRTMFDLVIPKDRAWVRHVAVGLSILSLLTLTLAFAKPKDEVSVPRERATIVVTIDVSLSMEATDVEPDSARSGQDGGRGVRELVAAEVQRRSGHVRRHRDHAGATHARPRYGDRRHRGPPAAAVDGHRRRDLHVPGCAQPGPADPDDPDAVVPARIVLLSDGKTQVGRPSDQAARAAR